MSSDPEISVIGAGGHGKAVVAALQAAGYEVTCSYDDDLSKWNDEILGVPVRGPIGDAAKGPTQAVLALPDPEQRRAAAAKLELEWLTVVHPHSWVAPTASLGPGAVVLAGAVVQSDTKIGCHVLVDAGAVIGNDCQLEDFVHLAAGCILDAAVWIGEGTRVGLGTRVMAGRRIGTGSTVLPGSVVLTDVPDGVTVGGNPAVPVAVEPVLPATTTSPAAAAPPAEAVAEPDGDDEDDTKAPIYDEAKAEDGESKPDPGEATVEDSEAKAEDGEV